MFGSAFASSASRLILASGNGKENANAVKSKEEDGSTKISEKNVARSPLKNLNQIKIPSEIVSKRSLEKTSKSEKTGDPVKAVSQSTDRTDHSIKEPSKQQSPVSVKELVSDCFADKSKRGPKKRKRSCRSCEVELFDSYIKKLMKRKKVDDKSEKQFGCNSSGVSQDLLAAVKAGDFQEIQRLLTHVNDPHDVEKPQKTKEMEHVEKFKEEEASEAGPAFEAYFWARKSLLEQQLRAELSEDKRSRCSTELERLKAAEGQGEAERAKLYLEEHILNFTCPKCLTIIEYADSFALTCTHCEPNYVFCVWCLQDCGEDPQTHLANCQHNLSPGKQLRGAAEIIQQAKRERNQKRASKYLESLPDGVRGSVLQSCSRRLADVGLCS